MVTTEETAAVVGEHFFNCHPEHEHGPDNPPGYEPTEIENCWHCGTATQRGCTCPDCWKNQDYVPSEAAYHCALCGRWWAHMNLRVTKITFGGDQ